MRFAGEQWIRDHHQPMLPDVERLHLLKVRTLLLIGGRDFERFQGDRGPEDCSSSTGARMNIG
jgi:hypothetical protein